MFRYPSCAAELDWDINSTCNILFHYLTVISKEPVYAVQGNKYNNFLPGFLCEFLLELNEEVKNDPTSVISKLP
ncbi:hypothetical protein Glove_152g11 [Diversispora epigaea]|uniref:Uncharacterized protein n=1 Tax=Diversispora epigaea TaxID=1348612 RepID=A0A397J184_9GLOM|nr:hypothetical protein Glove_152g11 [Diversispora epigaea]